MEFKYDLRDLIFILKEWLPSEEVFACDRFKENFGIDDIDIVLNEVYKVAREIVNPESFERLRALRKRLADAEGVPAYIVFSDAVLREMAKHAPRTRRALLGITGVGPVKLERYGDAFLEVITDADEGLRTPETLV